MKITTSALVRVWRFTVRLTAVLAFFMCCGCAHLATVKTMAPRVPTIAASEGELITRETTFGLSGASAAASCAGR